MKVLLLVALLAATPVAAPAQSDPICAIPDQTNDGWHVADPSAEGMGNDRLGSIGVHFVGKKVHAVLVARHGVLVYEHYFAAEAPPS
jgi:hypothetical protein